MARKLRIEFAGAVYHVISRGDRGGETIYEDHEDRLLFLEFQGVGLEKGSEIRKWKMQLEKIS
jgi:hypothetical protein